MLNFNDPVAQKDGTIKPLSEGSGGGGGGSEYSTEEVAIGKWIDGKTLYRKVYSFDDTIALIVNSWKVFDTVDLSEVDTIVNGFVHAGTSRFYPYLMLTSTDNKLQIFSHYSFDVKFIVIEYTKKG